MANTTGSLHAKIPVRWRIKAWWEGYDPELHQEEPEPIEAGDLKVCRILGVKKPRDGLLSDW